MLKIKRLLTLICCASALMVAACSTGAQTPKTDAVSIVCTTFASYDWMREIAGDTEGIELTYLLDEGVDMHSYQPSVADLATISSADLLVYVGGESDAWVDDALKGAENTDIKGLSLLEVVGDAAREEEVVEGMQAREEEHAEGEGEEEETEYDEHVWLSPALARIIVSALTDEVSALDPAHAEEFQDRARAYGGKLEELDNAYLTMAKDAAVDTVIFCDRFPFRYLFDELNLTYFAAFPGCSAETEASFDTIAFLIEKLNDLGLDAVMVCEDSDQKLAQTVIADSERRDAEILVMDSLQSVSGKEVEEGRTYLATMQDNLEVLKTALTKAGN